MEVFGFIDIPLWLLLVISCLVLLYRYGTSTLNTWKNLSVIGPMPTAFFGNVQDYFDSKRGTRRVVNEWTQKYGRSFGMYFFRKPVLVTTDLDILKEVFVKDFPNFVDRFMAGDGKLQHRIIHKGVFFEDGLDWKRIRKIMTPTFSSGKLKLMIHFINQNARQLTENLVKNAQEGIHPCAKVVFGAYALDVIAGTAFGLELNSLKNLENRILKKAQELMAFGKLVQLRMAVASIFPQTIGIMRLLNLGFFRWKPVKFFRDNIQSWINERKNDPNSKRETDFLQLLINAEVDPNEEVVGSKKLTEEEVVAQGIIFVIAGYETTSTTLQFLMYELSQNHEVQDKIVDEIQRVVGDADEPTHEHCQSLRYVEAAISETLRMYPPVNMLTRLANKETTLKGIPIPAGTPIFIPIYNIGRDPEYFEDPDTFNPDRFLNNNKASNISFLPFGFGPRQCIGMRLAIMELKLAITHILRKVVISDSTPKVLDLEDYSGILVPKEPIKLILKQR